MIRDLRDHFDEEHALECYWCYKKFDAPSATEAFRLLAEHVNEYHVPPAEKARRSVENQKESEMSLPIPGRGGSSSKKGPRAPYLKAEHLEGEARTFLVTKVVQEATDYSDLQVLCDETVTKEHYILGLRLNSENYRVLFGSFGEDEKKWVGREFVLSPQISEISGNERMVASVVKQPKQRK